jgi:hypothetical protein
MVQFADLVFETGAHPDIQQARINGFSVITGPLLHGGDLSLYEVMDLDGECHGHLNPNELMAIINKE